MVLGPGLRRSYLSGEEKRVPVPAKAPRSGNQQSRLSLGRSFAEVPTSCRVAGVTVASHRAVWPAGRQVAGCRRSSHRACREPLSQGKQKPNRAAAVAQTTLASARQWCGSKGAYDRPSYPCHYCTYRGGLLRQGAVDKAKADDQRHAGERQHHHLNVRKAVVGKQRKIVHDMLPPKTSLSLVGASRQKVHGGGLVYLNKRFRSASTSRQQYSTSSR